MYIDSHCHLDFEELLNREHEIIQHMKQNEVTHALCVSVHLEDFPKVLDYALRHDHIFASVGVHPDYDQVINPSVETLCRLAQHEKIIAIGETGLDYFRMQGDLTWQKERFINHIESAKLVSKPLIIHTRNASEDTISILKQHQADEVGGVMHCFTESWEVAQQALDLGFYISFSGIVSFKNAKIIHDVATKVPLDRLLIETDSPYLAPVPYRGKTNEPAYVKHVAEAIAKLRDVSPEEIGIASSQNFKRLFKLEHLN